MITRELSSEFGLGISIEVTMDWEKLSKAKIKQTKGFQRKLWMIFLSDLRDRHTQLFKHRHPKRMRKAV